MKKINWFAPAATLLSLHLLSGIAYAAREDLPTLFDEDTLFYIEIPSVPQLQEDWEANPFYELYQREEVKEFIDGLLEAFMEDEAIEDEFGGVMDIFDEEDQGILDGLLSGQIAFGISRLDFLSMLPNPTLSPEENAVRELEIPNFWLVFDYDDDTLKEKLIKDMEEEEDEYIEYEDFYIILADEISVAYNDDIVAITNTEESAIKFVDRYLGNDSQASLADNDNFQEGFIRLYENSEIFYHLDLTVISDLAEEAAANYGDYSEAMVQQGQLAPNDTILEALGLDTFQGVSGSIDMDPAELKSRSLLQLEPNDGFFGKLFGHYGDSLPDTSFLSEDLRQVTVGSFDISGMLHDLEQAIATISPMAGQIYFGQKAQVGQMASVPADNALIDNFSDSFYVVAGETPNTAAAAITEEMPGMESYFDQGNTFIIGIHDRLAFEAFVDSTLSAFNQSGLVEKQDYLGFSQYLINTPQPTPGPSVFVSDQFLLIEQTNPDFAKLVVASMQTPTNPIFERRDIGDALNELPPDPIGVRYVDAEKFMGFLSKLFKRMSSTFLGIGVEEDGEENPFASLEVPVIDDFKYFSLATSYKDDDDFVQQVILRPKSD